MLRTITPLLWRASRRYLLRHPWQLGLAVLGIALGVALVVAVELATQSAGRAFDLTLDALKAQATHQIVGGASGLDQRLYIRLRRELGIQRSAPVIESYLTAGGQTLRLLGVDPFAERGLRDLLQRLQVPGEGALLRRLTIEPGAVLMTRARAARLGLAAGAIFSVEVSGRQWPVRLIGLLAPDGPEAAAVDDVLLADISTAQELIGLSDRLSRIDVRIEGPDATRTEAALRAWLPAGTWLIGADTRGRIMHEMTRAFRLNLNAMSLLALVVGMFLIYNTMAFSVLQRRSLLGSLRVLGAGRRDICLLVLGEGLLLGLAGTLLGLPLGIGLAQELTHLVTRTIDDLYFALNVSTVFLTPAGLGKGVALGMGATLLAVLLPAGEAALTPPRAVLDRSQIEQRVRRLLGPLGLLGLLSLTLAALLLLPGSSLVLGFVALFLMLLGCSLLIPQAVAWGCRLAAPLPGGTLGRLAVRGVEASLSRTGIAIAALSIAVSATVGVGVMVGSFRASVAHWLDVTLQADIYVAPPASDSSGPELRLRPELLSALERLPGIAEISRGRPAEVLTADGITRIFAIHMASGSYAGVMLLEGEPAEVWPMFDREQAVLVSEPYAYRHRLRPGDILSLTTDRGEQPFRVAGVYRDYGTEQGVVMMRLSLYRQYWDDDGIYSVGLYLEPGVDLEAMQEQVRALGGAHQQLRIRPNRVLRDASLEIFDRTFAITQVLRLLVIAVAMVGILSALMALQLEKARELGVLRATGLTPRQLWLLVTGQSGFMGLLAGLLALPMGLLLALVLIHVINRRAFGWGMELIVPGGVLIEAVLLAVLAALLAGLWPAWHMARTAPAQALREE